MSEFSFNNLPPNSMNYNDLQNTVYNTNTSHPLIPNSQEYIYYKKYISIHSEDRDLLKYPNSSEFEVELPEDYLNVSTLKLVQWTFPANYNTFSRLSGNDLLAFTITNPYNPGEFNVLDTYNSRIFQALFNSMNIPYYFQIENGFYNPLQLTNELTNKFNSVVTNRIKKYFIEQNTLYPNDGWDATLTQFIKNGGYTRFVIVYNNVSLRLWFGNRADNFTILSSVGELTEVFSRDICSSGNETLPDFSNYGLPSFLGLTRCNQSAGNTAGVDSVSTDTVNGITVPRFYYGDVFPGDDGFWLLPLNLSGCQVYWTEAAYKLNIMGDAYMYMELDGQNCIDETKPFNVSNFTLTTNKTNGVVNSAFAKLPVPTTPLSQWFDRDALPYKFYYPPAERMRKIKVKIRYHNGTLVDFGVFNYSFMLEFTLMLPQILRKSHVKMYPSIV